MPPSFVFLDNVTAGVSGRPVSTAISRFAWSALQSLFPTGAGVVSSSFDVLRCYQRVWFIFYQLSVFCFACFVDFFLTLHVCGLLRAEKLKVPSVGNTE